MKKEQDKLKKEKAEEEKKLLLQKKKEMAALKRQEEVDKSKRKGSNGADSGNYLNVENRCKKGKDYYSFSESFRCDWKCGFVYI